MKTLLRGKPLSACGQRRGRASVALLLDLKSIFYIDWINHTWLVSYYSEYFRVHHSFPHVVNSQQIIGLPNPIFYGHAFYAVGGLFGSVLGPDVGVRIWILLATAAQFYAVDRLFRVLTAHRGFSLLMAVLVTWAIYPLTNLYNRSAITEYRGRGVGDRFGLRFWRRLPCRAGPFLPPPWRPSSLPWPRSYIRSRV